MAILVAGGAGYIGSHTCVELLERGYEVVVVDNLYNSSEVALERVQEITGKTLKFYKGDILNREDLEPIFENEEIEAVINFAGLKAVGESVEKPWEYYHNNITGTLILCDVMRKHGCKNMIFSLPQQYTEIRQRSRSQKSVRKERSPTIWTYKRNAGADPDRSSHRRSGVEYYAASLL